MMTLDFVEESVGGSVGSVGKAVGKALGKCWKSVGIYPLNGKALVHVFLSEVTFWFGYGRPYENLIFSSVQ